jgi:predicted nucleic acid-binding protein
MQAVFADTAYYVAEVNSNDSLHQLARDFTNGFTGRVITTEFVLTELAPFLLRGPGRRAYVDLIQSLRRDSLTTVLPATSEYFELGFQLFSARPDKEWSLTDCISFEVMKVLGLHDALTADHHFEQAGFRPLLKPIPL